MKLSRLLFLAILLLSASMAYANDPDDGALTPITIKLQWQHQFQFAGIYAAIEKGFYRNAGMNVSIQTGFTHPYDEVEKGQVQFGISGTGIVVEYLKGRPLVALGATFQNSPYAWLVRSDSGIYSAEDFIGKTLTRQSYADDLAAIFLKQHIDIEKIHFVAPGANDIDNLIDGKVNAITAYVSNEPFLMGQRGVPYRTITPADYNINFYSDILFTSASYAKLHPQTVAAFREATYKGWRYAFEHQDEIIDLILAKYNTQNKTRDHLKFEAEQLFKLSLYPTVDFGHMSLDRWRIIADIYQRLGLYKSARNLEQFIYKPTPDNDHLFKWLAIILAILSGSTLLGYQLKKQHNLILKKQINQQTASLESELQKRKELESAAEQEKVRLQLLLDNTLDSVITINQQGIIEHFNKAATLLFGYSAEEVLGQNITMLMPANYRDLHQLGMARFLSTEKSKIIGHPTEIEALHKSGKHKPIELTISEFRWNGEYLFTGIARDISKQKAEQRALLEAKLEAERANNAKSEFLSTMSHELRTPLNGILGFSHLLLTDQDSPLSAQQTQQIEHIVHSGEHLLTLINDVLELSKIEAGNLNPSIEPIAIRRVVAECLPMLETLAAKHHISIKQKNILNASVLADFTRFKQIFINLVINAIKYNRAGGEVIVDSYLNQPNIRLTIKDTGMGIPVDRQDKVFTAFERLGQEYANIEGSGVGLNVSKRLVEAMDGSIGFTSKEGEGSEFWIELPLTDSAPETNLLKENVLPTISGDELRSQRHALDEETPVKQILYIEDNPANIRLMEVFFSRLKDIQLHTSESAELALELMKTFKPDLVLMDINLSGMSGWDAVKVMQETPELKHIPVIALSADAMQENINAADGVFQGYITKPIDFALLRQTLHNYL